MPKNIIITESQVRNLSNRRSINRKNVDEMDNNSFYNDENLASLRDAINKNKTVSVAYVKKDGTVRHMGFRRYLKSYVGSLAPKSDAQQNVEANNDIKRVIDINAYIRELKQNGGDKEDATTKAWRTINLRNVLGFMAGGQFIDLRDENQIIERFGEGVYNQLTKAMTIQLGREQALLNVQIADDEPEAVEPGTEDVETEIEPETIENNTEINEYGMEGLNESHELKRIKQLVSYNKKTTLLENEEAITEIVHEEIIKEQNYTPSPKIINAITKYLGTTIEKAIFNPLHGVVTRNDLNYVRNNIIKLSKLPIQMKNGKLLNGFKVAVDWYKTTYPKMNSDIVSLVNDVAGMGANYQQTENTKKEVMALVPRLLNVIPKKGIKQQTTKSTDKVNINPLPNNGKLKGIEKTIPGDPYMYKEVKVGDVYGYYFYKLTDATKTWKKATTKIAVDSIRVKIFGKPAVFGTNVQTKAQPKAQPKPVVPPAPVPPAPVTTEEPSKQKQVSDLGTMAQNLTNTAGENSPTAMKGALPGQEPLYAQDLRKQKPTG